MKFPPFYTVLICAGLMAAPAHLTGQPAPPTATNAIGPRIAFATNAYHFGKVTAGTQVKYVFIVTNTGDQPLDISNVAPGCHCTTAGDWTHHIEPGQTGRIPIQFDSTSFRGQVNKTITVTSNDKLAPRQTISLEGTIWKIIDVVPQFAYITVMPEARTNATCIVHIYNQSDEMVTLSDPISANGSFKAELKILKPGKEFEVTVTAVPPLAPGNTGGTITLKTSFTNVPVISIPAMAMMQPSLFVAPQQIVLPPQVNGLLTNVVTIASNTKKMLTLSDPEVPDKSVHIEIKTIIPGTNYQLITVFPPGFQLASGQKPQVTVKSDNPEHPVITVPIIQYYRRPIAPPPQAQLKVMSQPPPLPQATAHP